MADEKGHAGHDGGGPDACPNGPPDGDRVDEELRLGTGLQPEFGAHGDGICDLLLLLMSRESRAIKESDEVGKLWGLRRVTQVNKRRIREDEEYARWQMSGNLRWKPPLHGCHAFCSDSERCDKFPLPIIVSLIASICVSAVSAVSAVSGVSAALDAVFQIVR